MKILQISSARSIGGGELHVIDLSNELTARGHDVFVAASPSSPLRPKLTHLPAGNIAEFPLRNALDLSSAVKIAKFIRENEIELINAHFAKDYPVAAAASKLASVPLVITRHVLFPMNRMHRVALRDVKYVIAPSNAVAESLQSQNLFPSEKIVTIRYGIDVEKFSPRVAASRNEIHIGSIGNLDPVKGFDILIRAAAIVVGMHPNVKFKIVGEDRSRDGRNEHELKGLIAALDLGDKVELVGWSDDVATTLASFDIFVSASRSESFGFVIAEAMLSGVPVIATETEGAKEIISDSALGRLVPVESPESLAVAMVDQITKLDGYNAQAARHHIIENFSLKRTIDETESLYRSIMLKSQ